MDTRQIYGDLVGRPIPHSSAMKHATGEARYCDDIPKYGNELSVALVLSERAHAYLKKVDPTKGLLMEGVVGYISHHDLPPGKNCFGVLIQDEEIFASKKVCIYVINNHAQISKRLMLNSITNYEAINCKCLKALNSAQHELNHVT